MMKQWVVTLQNRSEGRVLATSSGILTENAVKHYFLGTVTSIVGFSEKTPFDKTVEIPAFLSGLLMSMGDEK